MSFAELLGAVEDRSSSMLKYTAVFLYFILFPLQLLFNRSQDVFGELFAAPDH
jgi:hypothetical protein